MSANHSETPKGSDPADPPSPIDALIAEARAALARLTPRDGYAAERVRLGDHAHREGDLIVLSNAVDALESLRALTVNGMASALEESIKRVAK